jgi:hypothetical protein
MATAMRCDHILPPGRRCNAPMREGMDGIGRVIWTCERCAARAAGRCWQCGKRRQNQSEAAAYCRPCKVRRERASQKASASTPEQRRRKREHDRKRRLNPAYQAYNTAHKRAWMAAHPEKFAEYAEKARVRWHEKKADPAWWEQQKARQRARYAERMARKRAAVSLDKTSADPSLSGAGQPPAEP